MSTKNQQEADYLGLPKKVQELIKTESDRGIILILAAYLEEILGMILKAAIITPKIAGNVLAHRQVLGDFDSRLTIAEAFGLIHSEDAAALRLVQKIRNKAAHFDRSGRGFDVLFDSPATADQVREFSKVLRESGPPPSFERGINIPLRDLFTMGCMDMVGRLMGRLNSVIRLAPPPTTKEVYEAAEESFTTGPLSDMALTIKRLKAEGNQEEALKVANTFTSIMLLIRPDLDDNLRLMVTNAHEANKAKLEKLRKSNSTAESE